MAKDVFDTPPLGMSRRGKKGRLKVDKSPQAIIANKVKQENIELRDRLAQLEEIVAGLTSKKKTKKTESE
jgi:hypothetical protein